MLRFIKEIEQGFRNKKGELKDKPHTLLIGKECVYIEGFVEIVSFLDESVSVKTKDYMIFVEGKNLYLNDIAGKTVSVCGEINKITFL